MHITSPAPEKADFGSANVTLVRSKSHHPGLLRVLGTELGDKKAKDYRPSQKSLRRSSSTPALAPSIRSDIVYKAQKYASKAPWALERRRPARLDLSLWRSKKSSQVTTMETLAVEKPASVPSLSIVRILYPPHDEGDRLTPTRKKLSLPEIPTVLVDMNGRGCETGRGNVRSFQTNPFSLTLPQRRTEGKKSLNFRSFDDSHRDVEQP